MEKEKEKPEKRRGGEKPGRKETQVRKQRRGRKGGPVQKKIRGKVLFQKVQVRGGRRP